MEKNFSEGDNQFDDDLFKKYKTSESKPNLYGRDQIEDAYQALNRAAASAKFGSDPNFSNAWSLSQPSFLPNVNEEQIRYDTPF